MTIEKINSTEAPVMMTQAEFARQQGWSRSYVTQLKQDGRLVMSDNGKKVDSVASVVLIVNSEDPNREDVRQRHAAEREGEGEAIEPVDVKAASSYQAARAVKERFNALSAKLNYEKESGLVVNAVDVEKAGSDLGTHIRSALENLPDSLSVELAPISDIARIHALLTEHFEALLEDVSRQLSGLIKVKT